MKRLLLCGGLLFSATALADWPTDAGEDIPVANIDTSQTPSVVADRAGGVFVIFAHNDASKSKTLRGEHFDDQGNRLWSTAVDAGLFEGFVGKDLLGTTLGTDNYSDSLAFSDEDGGFVAVYTPGGSGANYTLSLQRFDGTGTPLWAPTSTNGGVQLLANLDYYSYYYAIPDGLGGALVLYVTTAGLVSQRVDTTGATQYGNGYLIGDIGLPEPPSYALPYLSSDDKGGLYYIYAPTGAGTLSPAIAAVSPTGSLAFSVPLVAPTYSISSQWAAVGAPAGTGIWASWVQAGGPPYVLALQQFPSGGGITFADTGNDGGGLVIASTTIYSTTPEMLNDGNGGVIVAWLDAPVGTNSIYAQRFASDGGALWGKDPVLVSGSQTTPDQENGYLPSFKMIATPDGDVAIFWNATPSGIYGEKLDLTTGKRLWGPLTGGALISSAASGDLQWIDATFASDDSAYVGYQEGYNVYLKHVLADGTLGTSPPPDAGPADAGMDGGSDAGEVDAGPDAGPSDAGDSGSPTPDAGPVDAGIDAGSVPDAGTIADAGHSSPTDGGADGGVPSSSSGCSSATTSESPLWVMALGLVGLAYRRRHKRS